MKIFYVTGAIGLLGLLGLAVWNRYQKSHITEETVSKFYNSHNSNLKLRKYTDITATLSPETVVYPGDPQLIIEPICHVGQDSCFGLTKISMSNHIGTHIDFPAHIAKGAKTSSDYSISDLIGEGIIIEIPPEAQCITREHISSQKIDKNSFVFFKTSSSKKSKNTTFNGDYVYIDPEAAEALLKLNVKIVGIDSISVDSLKNESLPVHQLLLKNEILIVENLNLTNIYPGKCIVHISPLNIPGMDGLPARVVIER